MTYQFTFAFGNNLSLTLNDDDDIVKVIGRNNFLDAGNGGNIVTMFGDNNSVMTGSGNDIITLFGMNYTVTSGSGTDIVTIFGNGNHIVYGGIENNVVPVTGTDIITIFGNGNNTVYGGLGDDIVSVYGTGSNVIVGCCSSCIPAPANFYGSNILKGGSGDDFLIGVTGGYNSNGTIGALDSPTTTIIDDEGTQTLLGGAGNDILAAESGFKVSSWINVYLEIESGRHFLDGGAGNDILAGRAAFTESSFQQGFEFALMPEGAHLKGGEGNDILTGVSFSKIEHYGETLHQDGNIVTGNTTVLHINYASADLEGGRGNDFIAGGSANSVYLYTDSTYIGENRRGDDLLRGGEGNDTLIGDGADSNVYVSGFADFSAFVNYGDNDTLIGGKGNDILIGDVSSINSYYEYVFVTTGTPGTTGTSTGGLVADGYGRFMGHDTLQGGLGDDIIWGGFLRTLSNPVPIYDSDNPDALHPLFEGTFRAVLDFTSSTTVSASDTFVFDVIEGWDRDVLMDFDGVSADILLGNPDPLHKGDPFLVERMDNLEFKGVADLDMNGLDYHDVDAMITSIEATSSEASIIAGGFFERDERIFVDPETNIAHTIEVQGDSRSADAFTPEDGKVEVHFDNGSSIIFANVDYAGQTSIADLYLSPADAAAHILVM